MMEVNTERSFTSFLVVRKLNQPERKNPNGEFLILNGEEVRECIRCAHQKI